MFASNYNYQHNLLSKIFFSAECSQTGFSDCYRDMGSSKCITVFNYLITGFLSYV